MGAARRQFSALLVSDAATMLGAAMAVTATPFVVIAAGGDQSSLAWVSAAVLGTEVLALAGGGVLADRVSRQWVMMAADLLQAAATAVLAVAFFRNRAGVALIVGMSALRGLGLGLFLPASQGILPQIVAVADLGRANSLRRVTANIVQIGGALAGGVAVAIAGAGKTMAVIAAFFTIGAVSRAGLRGLRAQERSDEPILRAAVNGFREFASRRWLWTVVLGFAVLNAAFVGVVSVLGPLMVTERFRGATSWGAVAAATAAGSVLGAGFAYPWRPRRPLAIAVPFAALMALEPLALAGGGFGAVLAGAAAAGVGMEVFGVLWVSVLQQHVPAAALSRVSALDAMGSFAVSPLGAVAAGAAVGLVGVAPSLAAASMLIAVVCAALLMVPDVRRIGGPGTVVAAGQSPVR